MTDTDATIRRMARSGRSDCEIGKAIGRPKRWVCRRRQALGIRSGYSPALGAMMARLYLRRQHLHICSIVQETA